MLSCISDDGLIYVSEALSINNTLKKLVLSSNNSMNPNLFTSKSLSQLNIALKNNKILKNLKFNGLPLDLESIKCINNIITNNIVNVIRLAHCSMGSLGATELAKSLSICTSLCVLNLSHNKIGDISASNITNAIYNNKHFLNNSIYLKLTNNEISDKGAASFSNVLSTAAIWCLYLNDNNIGYSGALAMSNALSIHKSTNTDFVFFMSLKRNENIGTKTINIYRKLCQEKQKSFFEFYITFFGSLPIS